MRVFSNLLLVAILLFCFSFTLAHKEKKDTVTPHPQQRQHSHTRQMVQIVSNKHNKKNKKATEEKEPGQAKKGKAQGVLKADLATNFIETKARHAAPSIIKKNKGQQKESNKMKPVKV